MMTIKSRHRKLNKRRPERSHTFFILPSPLSSREQPDYSLLKGHYNLSGPEIERGKTCVF